MQDATMQLSEPVIENSGLVQGQFLRRHRVAKPDGTFFGPIDFSCGKDIEIYSRVYRIVSMDSFTRDFYIKSSMDPGVDLEIPTDPFAQAKQREIEAANKPLPADVIRAKALVNVLCGGTELNRNVRQYLEKDGKILRFYSYWDDVSEEGFRHFFHVHYFLADDTLEIIEVFPETESSAACNSLFLKRGSVRQGPMSPCVGDDGRNTIGVADLKTNATTSIGNRELVLYDCDGFTRSYYKNELHVDQPAVAIPKVEKVVPKLPVPPPTGFGSEEDSLASCGMRIVPRQPKMHASQMDHAGVVLRFEAKIENPKRDDALRTFTVVFYPADNSVAVWEVPVRNSGILGGKFAEKGRKRNPESRADYALADMHVGALVTVSAVAFRLTACDAFTANWLNNN